MTIRSLPSLMTSLAGAAGVIALAAALAGPATAQDRDRDRDMDQLREHLMDCMGPACVADRDRQMDQLRQRLQTCTDDCEPYRERLRLQEELRACDADDRPCPELRQREREHWRGMGHGGQGGQGSGQGSGQGGNRGG